MIERIVLFDYRESVVEALDTSCISSQTPSHWHVLDVFVLGVSVPGVDPRLIPGVPVVPPVLLANAIGACICLYACGSTGDFPGGLTSLVLRANQSLGRGFRREKGE